MTRGLEVRTSITHPLQVNWLPADLLEGVGLTFAPGKKGRSNLGPYAWDRDLATDLAALVREHRASTLVTLMETAELARQGIGDLLAQAREHGLDVIHFPIRDVSAPREPAAIDPLLDAIEARLASGQRVVIHCLGGIGRTGTIATCLLVRRGVALDDAIRIVQTTRCHSFPEGTEQGPFVAAYARHVARRTRPAPAAASSHAPAPTARTSLPWSLLGAFDHPASAVAAGRSRHDIIAMLEVIEREIAAAPERCFTTAPDGTVTLTAGGTTYAAGRFEIPTLGDLKARIRQRRPSSSGRVRLSILRGDGPHTDIGTLQATAPEGTLFQAASQFNCLESPGAYIVPIHHYPNDFTQGPRASVSAFPGTFLRHYHAPRPTGERFVQTEHDGINLLADAFAPSVARVRHGYLTSRDISDVIQLAASLEERFDHIRVGLHDDVEVVLGHDWGGPVPNAPHQRIAQVFTSTIALGGYGRDDGSRALATVRQQLLRAAYLGTLLGAVALGKHTVVLTLIGGGAFGNPSRAIWDAIHWAVDEAEGYVDGTLEVLVNARTDRVDDSDVARCRERGGLELELSTAELRGRT